MTTDQPGTRANANQLDNCRARGLWGSGSNALGLAPHWAKDTKIGYSTINVRLETADKNLGFRVVWKHRRCLIPRSGYYEWKARGASTRNTTSSIRSRPRQCCLAACGSSRSPQGEVQHLHPRRRGTASGGARPKRPPEPTESGHAIRAYLTHSACSA